MDTINRTEILFKMMDLTEAGKKDDARKLQKIIVASIRADTQRSRYSKNIEIDRAAKKTLKSILEH